MPNSALLAPTPDSVERGYNNRAAVPEHPRFIAQYVELSRAAIGALASRRDLRYGPGPNETLDLFVPAGAARGTFVFFHGGYWRAFDKSDFAFVAAPFAGGVTLSGVHDLEPLVLSTMNADLRLDRAEARRLSPVHYQAETDAPLVVACGADETSEFLRQSALIYDAWPGSRPRGSSAPLFIPGRHHFNVVLDYADPGSELTRATSALF